MNHADKETDKLLSEIEKRLKKEYKRATDEIAGKLDEYFRVYETKDAIKRKAVQNGALSEKEYKEWKIGQLAIGQRWEDMRDTVAQDLENVHAIANSIVNDYMPDVYALNHNFGTFEVEKQSRVDTSYTLYSRESVEYLMQNNGDFIPKMGKTTAERIKNGLEKAWNKKHVQSAMIQAIMQGESVPNMALRIARTVGDSDFKRAIRNARTLTTGVEAQGRVDAYTRASDMGIKMEKQWVATLDGRTRDGHRQLDGEKVGVNERFSNGLLYPAEPNGAASEIYNCRCTIVGQLAGFETDINAYRQIDPKLGDISYEEWKKGKPKSEKILKQIEKGESVKQSYIKEYERLGLLPKRKED